MNALPSASGAAVVRAFTASIEIESAGYRSFATFRDSDGVWRMAYDVFLCTSAMPDPGAVDIGVLNAPFPSEAGVMLKRVLALSTGMAVYTALAILGGGGIEAFFAEPPVSHT